MRTPNALGAAGSAAGSPPRPPPWRHRARHVYWQLVHPFRQAVRWPLIGVLAVLAVVLGTLGFDSYLDDRGLVRSFWDKLYLAIQLFVLQSGAVDPPAPAALHVARFFAATVTFYAATSTVLAVFREQIVRARVRWLAGDHVVVCGLGRIGHLLAHAFRDQNYRVVAIEKDPHNGAIAECREGGVTVIVGEATDRTLLAKIRVDVARYVFAVSGDDATNAKIAVDARRLVAAGRSTPLTCFVRVLDVDLAGLLRTELASRPSEGFQLAFFNPSELGAPVLLDEYHPFDKEGRTPLGPPHLLVVGLGEMGSRLALHAARRWVRVVGPDGPRLPVTVVDHDADRHVKTLLNRYGELERICEFHPRTMNVDDPEFDQGDFLLGGDGQCVVTGVYVCLGDDGLGLSAALRLRRRLPGGRPIVVRTKQEGGLGALVAAAGYEDLHVFGLLELVCRPGVVLSVGSETPARPVDEAVPAR